MFGVIMVVVCYNRFFVMIYGGIMCRGYFQFFDKFINILICYEVVGFYRYGVFKVSCKKQFGVEVIVSEVMDDIEEYVCFGVGVCGGMYMVNMMVIVIEVMGLCFFGFLLFFVEFLQKRSECEWVVEVICICMEKDI